MMGTNETRDPATREGAASLGFPRVVPIFLTWASLLIAGLVVGVLWPGRPTVMGAGLAMALSCVATGLLLCGVIYRWPRRVLRACSVCAVVLLLTTAVYPTLRRCVSAWLFHEMSGMHLPASADILYEETDYIRFMDPSYCIKFRVDRDDMKRLLRNPPPWAASDWERTKAPGSVKLKSRAMGLGDPSHEYYRIDNRSSRDDDGWRTMVIDASECIVCFELVYF